ncbi:MAG TPA: hypothetical protein VFA70_05020 [Dehalococcoidia bacterium]|jgi:hypothetical protein|nr:hypothetical protein [Dehalococcoidia bacterium]
MNAKEIGYAGTGVTLVLFGLIAAGINLVAIFNPTPSESLSTNVIGLLLAGVLPLLVGIWLIVNAVIAASRRTFQTKELTIIRLAAGYHGVLTVSQVAREGGMAVEEADEILRHLYHKGICDMRLADSGEIVYRFPEKQHRRRR